MLHSFVQKTLFIFSLLFLININIGNTCGTDWKEKDESEMSKKSTVLYLFFSLYQRGRQLRRKDSIFQNIL